MKKNSIKKVITIVLLIGVLLSLNGSVFACDSYIIDLEYSRSYYEGSTCRMELNAITLQGVSFTFDYYSDSFEGYEDYEYRYDVVNDMLEIVGINGEIIWSDWEL